MGNTIKLLFTKEPLLGMRVLFFTCLSIALMFFDKHPRMQWAHTLFSTLSKPITYSITGPNHLLHFIKLESTTHNQLLAENNQLKTNQIRTQIELQRFNLLQEENAQLRAFLQIIPQLNSQKTLVAESLPSTPDPFTHEMIINAGKNQGIFIGQAVLDTQGVLGQIIQVNPSTSTTLLITDTRSAIPVENTRTHQRTILIGNGLSNTLHLKHTTETTDVHVGDNLISSGLGGYFPKGYPIGKITGISKKKGEDFATVIVVPTAQFKPLPVLLIWLNPSMPATSAQEKKSSETPT